MIKDISILVMLFRSVTDILPDYFYLSWWINELRLFLEVIYEKFLSSDTKLHFESLFLKEVPVINIDINYRPIIESRCERIIYGNTNRELFNLFTTIYWGKDATDKEYNSYLRLEAQLQGDILSFPVYRLNLNEAYYEIEEEIEQCHQKNTIGYHLKEQYDESQVAEIIYRHYFDVCYNWKAAINGWEYLSSPLVDIFLETIKKNALIYSKKY